MSIETWLNEFYSDVYELDDDTSDIEAVKHSLRKWTGALPENLAKHDLFYTERRIMPNDDTIEIVFCFDSESCSLCHLYMNDGINIDDHECSTCPLYQSAGYVSCDSAGSSAYRASKNDPTPMIEALQKTITFLETK